MTPKEKAEELFTTYRFSLSIPNAPLGDLKDSIAKQCALIAVDYMICNAGMIWGGRDTETGLTARDTFKKHWLEVKQELEKL
jgi:hypothetical protein